MVFSSSTFLFLFLPVFFIAYYAVPYKAKNIILCIFSLIFYAWGEPVYIVLMIFSSIVDYCNGLCMERFKNKKIIFLIISIIVNLSLLGFFKYAGLLITTVNSLMGLSIAVPKLALPVGISFYTFQTMSYSIDVYRGKVETEHNFLDFMAYVCMFPQLIAGPIVRYSLINEELHKRTIDFDSFCNGMYRMLVGLFKKVILANSVGIIFDDVCASGISHQSALTLWIAIVAFSLQIYFDFSGYSDMAIGMGRMLGFTFPENFDYPYCAKSITEFWRRWHMSLTTWFRDYVYISLGGSRKGTSRTIINIFIVWSLTGLWHGADGWNFMVWGMYFGVILILEKYILKAFIEKLPVFLKHIYVCVLAAIGWTIFSFTSIADVGIYIKGLFNFGNIVDTNAMFNLSQYGIILIIAMIFATPIAPYASKKLSAISINHKEANIISLICEIVFSVVFILLFILSIAMIISDTYNPFLYFRF